MFSEVRQVGLEATIGFIGAGNMADAMIRGIVGQHVLPADAIWATNRSNRERLYGLAARYAVRVTPTKPPLLDASQVLILAVKPKDVREVLDEITGRVRPEQLVISVAAGIPLNMIERALPGISVIRAMPNTSAAVQASATALAPGTLTTDEDLHVATEIFQAVGDTITVTEDVLDVVTGLSGSGPAYVYRLTEAMIHAGTELGLPVDLARRLAVQTLIGAARMLAESAEDPAELRRRVTSPGGTTMAALRVLEDRGFAQAVRDAVHRAAERARELAKEHAAVPKARE